MDGGCYGMIPAEGDMFNHLEYMYRDSSGQEQVGVGPVLTLYGVDAGWLEMYNSGTGGLLNRVGR